MLGNKPMSEWIDQYSLSHQHPVNKALHTIGIPMIAISLPLFLVAIVAPGIVLIPILLFIVGWVFQIIGHIFEGKPPEFFHDWRFLFIGLRWWFAKTFNTKVQR